MKSVHRVSNGVNRADFPKTNIEKMEMLGLIQFRFATSGQTNDGDEVQIFHYTAAFDNRQPVGKGKW